MISNQILQSTIEGLKNISRLDMGVLDVEGKVLVADPNSRERSLMAWDPELILSELSASRSSGAPLWRFSALTP